MARLRRRYCVVCNKVQTLRDNVPSSVLITNHEAQCFRAHPNKIPPYLKEAVKKTWKRWERYQDTIQQELPQYNPNGDTQ